MRESKERAFLEGGPDGRREREFLEYRSSSSNTEGVLYRGSFLFPRWESRVPSYRPQDKSEGYSTATCFRLALPPYILGTPSSTLKLLHIL